MIISASRRTDLPAFYSAWLMNRLRAGFCLVPNPFNPNRIRRVSLAPAQVDAIVFWSKNPRPLLPHLEELGGLGFPYYFQFTLNDYPSQLEPGLPPLLARLETFHALAKALGPARVVWRYDPIIITPATDFAFHAAAFENLCRLLQGATRRVVVSLVDPYRKTRRHMAPLHPDGFQIDWETAHSPGLRRLLSNMAAVAERAGMEIFSCAEEQGFLEAGIRPGRCVDAQLVRELGGKADDRMDPGQRPACGCAVSVDIGVADTCLHGCPYCYATVDSRVAHLRNLEHDPESPILVGAVGEIPDDLA